VGVVIVGVRAGLGKNGLDFGDGEGGEEAEEEEEEGEEDAAASDEDADVDGGGVEHVPLTGEEGAVE
jgi:hypothetical protein